MKLSSQEEYGLRCLLQIARKGQGASATISEIAQIENLTTHYVAKLLRVLRKSEFITSVRGQTGGYTLARDPHEIVVGDVLEALGGKIYESSFCDRFTGLQDLCTHSINCTIRSLFNLLQTTIDGVVKNITLQDLLGEGNGGLKPPPETRMHSN